MAHHLTLTVYHIPINIGSLIQFQFCSTIFPVLFHFSVCEDSDDELIFCHPPPSMGTMGMRSY